MATLFDIVVPVSAKEVLNPPILVKSEPNPLATLPNALIARPPPPFPICHKVPKNNLGANRSPNAVIDASIVAKSPARFFIPPVRVKLPSSS